MKTTIRKTRRPVILYLVVLSLMLGVTSVSLADTFTTIDFPGPGVTRTAALGINAPGDIVGGYSFAGGVDCVFQVVPCHGFLLSGSTFTSIDFPGATVTVAQGINPRGDIVGRYFSAGVTHGFLLSGDEFTTIDFPGATLTFANAINPRGDIVGRYDSAGATHGYLLSGGEFTTIDFPGATLTFANAINPRGDIVGRYFSADGIEHGFLLSGGGE